MSDSIIARIAETQVEARDIVTIRFHWEAECSPGQFIMVWIPCIDEIPMSLSYLEDPKGFTVRRIGEATEALMSVMPGDKIGIRGPFGRGFEIPDGRILVVGGGTGISTLLPFIERLDGQKVDVALGATSSDLLFFIERASRASAKARISTDDGSLGFRGTVVELVKEMLKEKVYDHVVACGPEKMLFELMRLCEDHRIDYQFSLERYMKCGVGVCGSCAIDGKRVCADGPVFGTDELRKMMEFGRWKRDVCGRRTPL